MFRRRTFANGVRVGGGQNQTNFSFKAFEVQGDVKSKAPVFKSEEN